MIHVHVSLVRNLRIVTAVNRKMERTGWQTQSFLFSSCKKKEKLMIVGHGIDLQDIEAIDEARKKHIGFPKRILTSKEFERYSQLKGRKQVEYLAGRWAAKEAFSKALGTGIGKVGFQDIEILNTNHGAPFVSFSPFSGKVWISISHSSHFVQASVILEEENDRK